MQIILTLKNYPSIIYRSYAMSSGKIHGQANFEMFVWWHFWYFLVQSCTSQTVIVKSWCLDIGLFISNTSSHLYCCCWMRILADKLELCCRYHKTWDLGGRNLYHPVLKDQPEKKGLPAASWFEIVKHSHKYKVLSINPSFQMT